MTYRIAFLPGAARVAVSGDVTMPPIRDAIDALLRLPEWTPGLAVLWDLTRIDSMDVTPESLRALAAFDRTVMERAGPGRTALVMRPNSDLDLGLLYTLLVQSDIRTHRAFEDVDEALAWLRGPDASAHPESTGASGKPDPYA